MMLTEICEEIKNYFTDDASKHFGTFKVSGGDITPSDFLQQGQYFRIAGSAFNDGVYKYPAPELQDEEFVGAVWAMKAPPSFIALCGEIKEYCKSDASKPSAFTSESFGGYSYTKAEDTSWQKVFSKRLNSYRRARL